MSIDSIISQLGQRESGNNYGAIGPMTKYGRPLGKYQFLPTTLSGYSKMSTNEFLKNPEEQERVMTEFTQDNINYGFKRGVLNDSSSPSQIAAFARAAHIGGPEGAVRYFKTGYNPKDSLGTSIGDYAKMGDYRGNVGQDVVYGDAKSDTMATTSTPTPTISEYQPVISQEELKSYIGKLVDPATLSELDARARDRATRAQGWALLGSLTDPSAGYKAADVYNKTYNQEYITGLNALSLPAELGMKERSFGLANDKRAFDQELSISKLLQAQELGVMRNMIAAERAANAAEALGNKTAYYDALTQLAKAREDLVRLKTAQGGNTPTLTPYQEQRRQVALNYIRGLNIPDIDLLSDAAAITHYESLRQAAGDRAAISAIKSRIKEEIEWEKSKRKSSTPTPTPTPAPNIDPFATKPTITSPAPSSASPPPLGASPSKAGQVLKDLLENK